MRPTTVSSSTGSVWDSIFRRTVDRGAKNLATRSDDSRFPLNSHILSGSIRPSESFGRWVPPEGNIDCRNRGRGIMRRSRRSTSCFTPPAAIPPRGMSGNWDGTSESYAPNGAQPMPMNRSRFFANCVVIRRIYVMGHFIFNNSIVILKKSAAVRKHLPISINHMIGSASW